MAAKSQNGNHDPVDDLKKKFEKTAEAVSDKFESAQEHLENLSEQFEEKGEAVLEDVTEFVDKHPVKALGVAFLAGVVIGMMVSGGKSK